MAFPFFKKTRAKPVGDLYVSMVGGEDPELFLDLEPTALADIQKQKYVTMRVIIVKPDNPQK